MNDNMQRHTEKLWQMKHQLIAYDAVIASMQKQRDELETEFMLLVGVTPEELEVR